MPPDGRRSHLRPVPPPGGLAERAQEEDSGTLGVTPPMRRGHSGGFITDVLVELGYVDEERVEKAITEARTAGRPPETLLLENGNINGDQLSRAIAERYGLDYVDLSEYQVDMAAANLIPVTMARRYQVVPVGYAGKDKLLLAM